MSETKRKRWTQFERAAYHEAGHAVMAHIKHRGFVSVSIAPNIVGPGENTGIIEKSFHKTMYRNLYVGDATRAQVEREIMICAAGQAAVLLLTGRRWVGGHEGDLEQALAIAKPVSSGPKEQKAYVRWLWIRARSELRMVSNWAAVEALATALLEKKHLSATEARPIIGDTIAAFCTDSLERFQFLLESLNRPIEISQDGVYRILDKEEVS